MLCAIKKSGKRLFCHGHLFLFLAVFLPGVFFFATSPEAIAMSIAEVIDKAQDAYEKTLDMKANFIQEVNIKALNKTDREEGIFYFKNPRRMVWDYLKPKAKKMVINPQTAWLYIPEDRVVYLQDAEGVFKSKVSVRFLSGLGKLTEDFRITFVSPDNVDREGNFLLNLVPKERDFGIEEFFLTLDKGTFQVTRLSFTDSYGNKTRLLFRNIKINNNLTEKFFSFTPPAGVEVYRTR
jgi:outer membrane lipoprotein carrier protein